MGRKEEKKIKEAKIIATIIVLIIVVPLGIVREIDNVKKNRKEKQELFCHEVCENFDYKIEENTCICSNGRKIEIKNN